MELKEYPSLEEHISVSEVTTKGKSDILMYDTVTGTRKYPNRAVFQFLKFATGAVSFEEIVEELSRQSGEPFHKIWPGLSQVAERMVIEGLLKISDNPFKNPRKPPPSVEMVRRLENISLEITKQCNLQCKHCYADAGKKCEDELTLDEIKELIDELADIGVLSITFTGGEPLLHPSIFDMMAYARKKPLAVVLFTNGTLLTREIVKKLKELNIYRVNVSIDGPDADIHDEFRGCKGAFEKTVEGILLLNKTGISIHASTCLTKMNYKRVKEILELLKDAGITDSKVWPPTFSGRPDKEDVFITPEEFREAMVVMHEFNRGEPEKEFRYCKNVKNCGVGWSALSIKCNGVVTPCPSFGEDFSLGNIRDESLMDIWNNSPFLNKLRSVSIFEKEPCKECVFVGVCTGGCIADVYMRTGNYSCYDPYMCVVFEIIQDDFIPVEVDDVLFSDCALHFQRSG
jgi:radical SAM protein with 4Fe4S-binding SPASM domain